MPATGEMALAPPAALPSGPGPSSMLMASGTSGAAASPWRIRAPTSTPAPGASAQSAEAAVNAMTLARYAGSVPNRRARYAVAASPAPSASR